MNGQMLLKTALLITGICQHFHFYEMKDILKAISEIWLPKVASGLASQHHPVKAVFKPEPGMVSGEHRTGIPTLNKELI